MFTIMEVAIGRHSQELMTAGCHYGGVGSLVLEVRRFKCSDRHVDTKQADPWMWSMDLYVDSEMHPERWNHEPKLKCLFLFHWPVTPSA